MHLFLRVGVVFGGLLATSGASSLFAQETAAPAAPAPGAKDRHVVLVVWDGFRPDSIADEHTPTLAKLAREGTTFTRHHSVYPTSTEVNGTAMATGCYPGHSGLIGNREFRPVVDPYRSFATEELSSIRIADAVANGKYLRVPTLAEAAHAAGWRTAVAGTKPVAILHDRARKPDAEKIADESVTFYAGNTLPAGAAQELEKAVDSPFPREIQLPNVDQDAWTTEALTQGLWKDGLPKYSVLWMSDPDFTQHRYGPTSPRALRALESVDTNLATVLATLEQRGWRDSTDVLVVSDHGFSTIGRQFDVAGELTKGGVDTVKEFRKEPKVGQILSVGLGGSVFLYAVNHDKPTIQKAVDFLQKTEFAGVIFTREALPGTFSLATAHLDSPDAPDIVLAMRWLDQKSANGTPGIVYSDRDRKPKLGTHATLSRYDLHNTLVANGPSFKHNFRDELPSANTDLAPTIAHILGLAGMEGMDGRVLGEAMTNPPKTENALPAPVSETLRASRDDQGQHWEQYLQQTTYGGVTYFDEGNSVR